LVQDLARVQSLQLLGDLVAALNVTQLLANLGEGNGLIAANSCDYIVVAGIGVRSGSRRQQIAEHANAQQPDYDAEKNADPKFALIKSHP
jgi:hypothetical protein